MLNLYNFAVFIAVMLIVAVGAFAIALSFFIRSTTAVYKVTENAFRYLHGAKGYVWKKESQQPTTMTVTWEAGGKRNKPATLLFLNTKKKTKGFGLEFGYKT